VTNTANMAPQHRGGRGRKVQQTSAPSMSGLRNIVEANVRHNQAQRAPNAPHRLAKAQSSYRQTSHHNTGPNGPPTGAPTGPRASKSKPFQAVDRRYAVDKRPQHRTHQDLTVAPPTVKPRPKTIAPPSLRSRSRWPIQSQTDS
jgi:hypothetical protein